jgi:TonB family protein
VRWKAAATTCSSPSPSFNRQTKILSNPGHFGVRGGSTGAFGASPFPQETEEARAAKYQGTAVIYVEVGTDGFAHNITIARGLGFGLDENAVKAISMWKFQPATKDGAPVIVKANIEVNFRLM